MSGQAYARINSRAQLAKAIGHAAQAGALGTAMLLAALHRGEIAYQQVLPDGSVSAIKRFIAAAKGPAVLSIGDDDGCDRGSAGFPAKARALAWAQWILLHGSGAEREHYSGAILAAHLYERVLIIECSSATLPAWLPLVQAAPKRIGGAIIRPRSGTHPFAERLQ